MASTSRGHGSAGFGGTMNGTFTVEQRTVVSVLTLNDLLSRIAGPRQRSGKGWLVRCPCHADDTPSLSLTPGKSGKILLHCHAGCRTADILATIGLEYQQLMGDRARSNGARDGVPGICYDYVDETGSLSYQVVRTSGKRFRQRRPDGNGGWVWNLRGIKPLLYRLPDLLEAVALGKTVYVVEGEKDADRLWQHGLPATTNSGGAGKWRCSHSEAIRGAQVVIFPDNDETGRKHAQQVEASLRGVAMSSRIVELPNLPPNGDVTDWLDDGNTIEQLLQLSDPPTGSIFRLSTARARRIRLTDDEELMNLEDPGWLNEGRIPRGGTAQLFGESGALKSFIAVDLSCHIALGLDWHDKKVTQGNVVYVCAEGVRGMKHRVAAWKKYHGVEGKLGIYFLRHGIELTHTSADVRELLAEMQQRVIPPPVLIVIDTLARNLVGNENAAEDMSGYIKGCDLLREATGATVLSVHHSGYGETERARGSSSNRGAMDTDIQCLRDGDRVTLKNKKQKDAAEFPDVSFEVLSVASSLVLKPIDQLGGKLDGNRLLCLRAVHRLEGGANHSQWMREAELDNKKSSFNAARTWLIAAGYVKHEASGKYAITDVGKLALGTQSIASPQLVQTAQVSSGPSPGGVYLPPDGLDPNGSAAAKTS
jgi:hypothetical protein